MRNAEMVRMLKEVKAEIVERDLLGDELEEMQNAVQKLEEVVAYINDCTGRGIEF